jgi:acetyl-CoA synthetase
MASAVSATGKGHRMSNRSPQKSPRILVADDEVEMLQALEKILVEQGYDVETAKDGREATVKLSQGEFDAVVSDWKMPYVDGVELLQMAKNSRDDIVFIIITAYATPDTEIEAKKLGAGGYLPKPFKPADLIRAVKTCLEEEVRKPEPVEQKLRPSAVFTREAHFKTFGQYRDEYLSSIENPDEFWGKVAQQELVWFRKWDKVFEWTKKKPAWEFKWFEGGELNACYNCLDRHLDSPTAQRTAILWEPDDPADEVRKYTYRELYGEVCRFANVLRRRGVKRGDRVCIYLPMIPELPIAMLACARIGAIHSVVFGGFSAESLRERILDSEAGTLITSDEGRRAGRVVPLKRNADEALKGADCVKSVIVVQHTGGDVAMKKNRDYWWHDEMAVAEEICECELMGSEETLFILYTSGSTGKPKGVLHTTGGYMAYVTHTTRLIFDLKDDDIYWCTADIGWITGHSYILYGPLSNGFTSVMFEGVPTYPAADRFWEVCEKHRVSVFYTAPTAIRALMRQGDDFADKHPLRSLRLLGTVGEPINPEAWLWYHEHVGKSRCPIVDTWWQTETGGILITTLPGAMFMKPGSAGFPYFGLETKVLNPEGGEVEVGQSGALVLCRPWPAMLRTIWGDPERMKKQYFDMYPGYYFTGDGCRIDEEGFHWLQGRIDDVINVSGHRIGTAEVESALVEHEAVAESAVVGYPHEVKGQGIYAYVTLIQGIEPTQELAKELVTHVRKLIGPIATPDFIHFTDALPKTRSGKIMRRILRKIAANQEDFGDTSTLADPHVVERLVEGHLELQGRD